MGVVGITVEPDAAILVEVLLGIGQQAVRIDRCPACAMVAGNEQKPSCVRGLASRPRLAQSRGLTV